jgi:Domain of unknown function (DUF1905)
MTLKKHYTVKAKIFAYTIDPTSWYFVYVDRKDSIEIKENAKNKVGFGAVPVEVTLRKTVWRTTLFATKEGPYLLSLKKMVRQKEDLFAGDMITLTFRLL